MNAFLIEPKDEKQSEILRKIFNKLGVPFSQLSEAERKIFSGLKALEIAKGHPKYPLSEEEIMNMVKEVEEEVYGKK